MKTNLFGSRVQKTPQKTAQQTKAGTVAKRTVTFGGVPAERPPVMRRHAAEKMKERKRASDVSEGSDDAASSSCWEPESRPVASKETYRFYASWETLEKFPAREDQSMSTSSGTASAPSPLTQPGDACPRVPKLVVRVPNFSAPVSMMPSPVGTPRSELDRDSKRSPGRLSSFRKLGRELSRKLENISMTKSDKSSASSSSRGNTPRSPRKMDALASLAPGHLGALARQIQDLQDDPTFQSLSSVSKKVIVKAEILESLPNDSPLRSPEGVVLLLEEVNRLIAIERCALDKEIDLTDPAFSSFVASAADAAFIKPWARDSSDVNDELRCYLGSVKPSFARDFEHSDYFFRQPNGALQKLTSIDAFLASVKPAKPGAQDDFPMVVSNIASQNLGNFIKNVLFLRQDSNGVSQSVLKSRDGTPLMPLAVVKASYIFSKDESDAITIDYTWSSSTEINGAKEMRAKEMTGEFKSVPIERASMEIKVRARVEASGSWTVFDPHIRAKGWG